MTTTRQAKVGELVAELKKMKVGFCGVKYGCLVWRVSDSLWSVGRDSVSQHETWAIDSAAGLLSDLGQF